MLTWGILSVGVLLVYLILLFEITVWHVPSVASTYQLFYPNEDTTPTNEGLLTRVQGFSVFKKTMLLFMPSFIGLVIYLLPLFLVFYPSWIHYFGKIGNLESSWIKYTGLFIALAGRATALIAVAQMRQENRQAANSFSLKTKGIFNQTRNPINLSMYLTLIGLFMIFPTAVLLLGILFYIGNMHFRLLLEEDFLKDKFGENYMKYFLHTKRYL